jgi:hypothetical protein
MRFPLAITHNFLLEPVLHTFGVKAETSFVEIDGDALHVSMGVWFDERIPLSRIAQVAPSEWPWWGGLGVKTAPHGGVGVVGSTEGIVNVKLSEKQRVSLKIVHVEAEQLWLSLEDRDGFMKALASASGAKIGEHVPFWS